MTKLVVRRLALGVLTLWLISLIVFAAVLALPGDAAMAILGRDATPERITALRRRGARFVVCGNSLRGQKVAREALLAVPEGDIVPAGVVELTRLQQEGFAYIRP